MTMFGMDTAPYGRGLGSYANPHMTIAMRDIPTHLKQVMRLCRHYANTDSLLAAVIDKMSEYPITAILIKEKEPEQPLVTSMRQKWEDLINVTLNLRQVLMNINKDVFIFGNCFFYFYYPFVRYVVRPGEDRVPIGTVDVRRVIVRAGPKFTFQVEAYNPKTKKVAIYDIEDRKSESRSGFKMIRISPLRMTLKANPTSGAKEWMWSPPTRMKEGFLIGDRTIIDSTEMAVLEAIYKDQKIKMNPNRLWVSQAPEQPDLWDGWGVPPIFKVLEDVYYMKVLRRANEALAQEHVTPLRFLSPRGTGDVSPQRTINLSDWQNRLKRELQCFKSDPNHIVVSPIPVEVEQMGGNARVMMVAAEMEAAARTICSGVGCPVEMIWGGLNWSGGSISLRVLENHFINSREDSERLLDFLAPKLASYYGLTPIKMELAEFRMADDAQHQANAINLMLQGYLSRESVIGEMNYDPAQEFDRLEKEHERLNQITMKDNVAAAHMNSVIQSMEAKASILLQYDLQITQQGIQAQSERERLRQLQAHVADLHKQGVTSPMEFDQSAFMLQRLDPNMSNAILASWQQTMPNVTRLLMAKMNRSAQEQQIAQSAQAAPGAQSSGMAEQQTGNAAQGPYAGGGGGSSPSLIESPMPQPEQRPPRRKNQ